LFIIYEKVVLMACYLKAEAVKAFIKYMSVILLIAGLSVLFPAAATAQHDTQSAEPIDMLGGFVYRWGDSPLNNQGFPEWVFDRIDSPGWIPFENPGRPDNPDRLKNIWIKTEVPEGEWGTPVLFFRLLQQNFEVYFEDEIIYSYGSMDFSNKNKAPGSKYHFISIPPGSEGKTVSIRMYSPFPEYAGSVSEFRIGLKSDIILQTLRNNIKNMVVAIISVFAGCCFTIFYFERKMRQTGIFMIGFSSVCLGIWIAAESAVVNLFIDNPLITMYTAYFAVFTAPIGISIFINKFFRSRSGYITRNYWKVYPVFIFAVLILEFGGFLSIFYTVKLFHAILTVNIAILFLKLVKAALGRDPEAGIFILGFSFLAAAAVHDMIIFYNKNTWLYQEQLTYIGMLVFILTLVYIIVRRYIRIYNRMRIRSRERDMNYKILFENMSEGFLYGKVTLDGNNEPSGIEVLQANKALEEKMGLTFDRLKDINLAECIPQLKRSNTDWNSIISDVTVSMREFKFDRHLPDVNKWLNFYVFSPKKGYFGVLSRDITERKKLEQLMIQQAYNDPVTGLYNRTFFEEEMSRINENLTQYMPVSILSIDIDGLKVINDTLGHKAGDDLLKNAASIISDALGENATVARIGGDEFGVILVNTGYDLAIEKKNKIIELMEQFNSANNFVPVSMSIGAAAFNEMDIDIYDTFKRSDDRMYKDKISQSVDVADKVTDILTAALRKSDFGGEGHIERMVHMAQIMSMLVDIPDDRKRNLILLAKMHDIGNIEIPDGLLYKPGKLTEKEYEIIKEHVKLGFNIASRSRDLTHIAELILFHHERWDGKGYPKGLKGLQIPIECRILAIIDSYDAMTSKRVYRERMSKEAAIEELRRCAGSQFDPEITSLFINAI
jgi:diguanylate cyclase (GGDEF)-like protein